MQTKSKYLLLAFSLSCLILAGCGTSSTSSSSALATTNLSGTLTDGPISNAKVSLATFKNGAISNEVLTDEEGNYTIQVSNAVINDLSDEDLPYIYASSTANSKVKTSGGSAKDLVEGQVNFRSLLAVNQLKTLVSDNKTAFTTTAVDTEADENLQDLARSLTISHVSNAKALVLESKLLAKGVLKEGEQINPKVLSRARTVAQTEISEALNEVAAVDLALEDPNSEETANLMMLAAVTKEIVEQGKIDDIVTSATAVKSLTNAAKFLLELSRERKAFTPTFNTRLSDRLSEVNSDLTNRLKGSVKTQVIDSLKGIDAAAAKEALDTDFTIPTEFLANQMFRFTDEEMSGIGNSAMVTFQATVGNTLKTFSVTQGVTSTYGRLLTYTDTADAANTLVFSYDNLPSSLKLVSIGADTINTHIGKLKLGITNVAAGVSVSLSKPVSAISGSSALSAGRFYEIEVNANANQYFLTLGSVKGAAGLPLPLGLVGVKGLIDSDTAFYLTAAKIKGRKFPVENGSITEALNEARQESIQGLKTAHKIASELRSSTNLSVKREAHLIYAVTNLAMHLNDISNPERTLSKLLDKLNVMDKGRNIFDFVAKIQKGSADEIVLNDVKGISDLQNYFATAPDSMVEALKRSIKAMIALESTLTGTEKLTDEILSLEWNGSTTIIQRKDLYFVNGALHLLKFAMHFLSAYNFDISDRAVQQIYASKNVITPITSFEMAAEFYSKEENQSPEITLLDVMKADPFFLTTRRGGPRLGGHLGAAKNDLLGAFDQVLRLVQAIEADGGDKNSGFYVDSDDLAELQYDKKVMLSLYNNLKGSYHPEITIGDKSGKDWYSLEASQGQTLVFHFDSTIRNAGPFDLNYVYGFDEEWYYDHNTQKHFMHRVNSFTRINTSFLFTRSVRSVLEGGSIKASTATSEEEMLESHVDQNGNLSATVTALFPGMKLIIFDDFEEGIPLAATAASLPETEAVNISLSMTGVSLPGNVSTSEPAKFRAYAKAYPVDTFISLDLGSDNVFTGKLKAYSTNIYATLHYSADGRFMGGSNDKFFYCWSSELNGLSSTIPTTLNFSNCGNTDYVPKDALVNGYILNNMK